jgi:biopolymer transport protein ExbD/biopolymer transport protein TolR
MTSGISRELRTEINVTPLIDILLVPLIIFIVIQPTNTGTASERP